MVRQINPSLSRLWLGVAERQYGVRPELILRNLTEGELRVLDYLELGISDNQIPQLAKMAQAGQAETQSLIERLGPLLTKTSSFLPELDAGEVERQFTEIMRLYLLQHKDPALALQRRRAAKVFVSSLCRTGLLVVRGLAASQIGTVFTADQKQVLSQDTLELGYPQAELGNQRARVARRLVSGVKLELHSRVSESYARADLAILIGNDVFDPALYATWMSRDVPHLGILFTEIGALVSHLVIPGVTPCLACVEIEKLNTDPGWARTAPQLANLDRNLADSSLALFAASAALGLSLNEIDQVANDQSPVTTTMNRDSAVFQLEIAAKNCGCRPDQ